MKRIDAYIRSLRQVGKISFTTSQALETLRISPNALRLGIHRLKAKGDIVSPAKGLFIIVPLEEQKMGSIPAEQLIPILMAHKKRRYYVGLLTAAMYYGASHQKPQVFQVVTDQQCRDLIVGQIRISFTYKKNLSMDYVQKRVVRTGYLNISSPEQTLIDLIAYPNCVGGLNNIATIITELIAEINVVEFMKLAHRLKQKSLLQRIGYLLEKVESESTRKKTVLLRELKRYLNSLHLKYTPLSHECATKGEKRNAQWKIIENFDVEED